MRKLYFAVAALTGTMFLFIGWLAEHERQAGIERLQQWRPAPSGAATSDD
jgi:hypothetical protein